MYKLFLIPIIISLISCMSKGFYSELMKNENIYEDYVKHKGNRETIKYLDKNLTNSEKIIEIGTFVYPESYYLIYDCTKKVFYFKENSVFYKEPIYYHNPLSEKNELLYANLIFVLDYVLNDKTEELKKISKEAYHVESGIIVIRIIDISKKVYEEYKIDSFDVYDGKPIMTEDEYWKIDWTKNK